MTALFKRYGFYGSFRLLIDVLNTKLFFKPSRIIRRPYYIRGKQFIKFGKGFTTGVNMRLDAFTNSVSGNTNNFLIEFGENVQVNDYVHIAAVQSVKIGNNVLIASKVFITDHNHGNYNTISEVESSPQEPPEKRTLTQSPVVIEDNVWIGEFVSVLQGVTIGKGAIVGTMSVVSKSIPAYSIAVGAPARVIKVYNFNTGKWEKSV